MNVPERKPRTLAAGLVRNKARQGGHPRGRPGGLRGLVLALAAALVLLVAPAPSRAELAAADAQIYRDALRAAEAGRFAEARQIANRARQDLPAKVIRWLELTAPDSAATWDELNRFLETEADWPNLAAIRRNAEAKMPDLPAAEVLAWFEKRPPLTTGGFVRHVDALLETKASDKAIALVRERYVDGSFGVVEERDYRKRFNSLLRPQDHWARLDRLLWDGDEAAVKRMMPLVDKGRQNLALARLALANASPGVEGALRRLPPALLNDPGLLYERLRWRRRKDQDAGALEILAKPPKTLGRPDAWWQERHIMARRMIEAGKHKQAYQLAAQHGSVDGLAFAQAEFLAGWLALRFLDRPAEALKHFETLYRGVSSPLSKSRGAYWAARALDAAGDKARAKTWYETAVSHGPTFYGMLAADALGRPAGATLAAVGKPDAAAAEGFTKRETVRLVRMLARIEGPGGDLTGLFMRRIIADAKDESDWHLVGALAASLNDPKLAVHVGRQALQSGIYVMEGFPLVDGSLPPRPEAALVHGIIRQESSFDRAAVSSAGARGLMQLMPATAQHKARELGLRHSTDKLTTDPVHNVRLGSGYLQELIDRFGGSYVLAIAAYNAGPGRVVGWLKDNGDPRTGGVDVIDWIEQMPIYETRNYVQRVLENTQIYRARLKVPAVRLTDELNRASGSAG